MRTRFVIDTVAAVAMMTGFVLAACSLPARPSPPTSEGPTAATKPYGSLTIAGQFDAGVLDPQGDATVAFDRLGSAMFDSLVYLTPDEKFGPGIAERWEISTDGKTHTFYIRKGVKFHDGSDLSGTDVKFSIERNIAPESVMSSASVVRAVVDRVELIDDHTVAVRLKKPQFEPLRGSDRNSTAVVPKSYVDAKGVDYFRKNPIGSGAYKFVRYDPMNRLELEANEDYWGAVPKFKNITVLNIPEEATRIAMLKTGELDIARISPDSVAELKAAGLHIANWNGGQSFAAYYFYDVENPQKYAFGDVRVRKALALALNRKEMIDNIFRGYASPTILYPISPKVDFFDPNILKTDPYDPDQTKRLLGEAGYPTGLNTRIYNTTGQTAVLGTVNQAIASYWRKMGVIAELVPIDYPTFASKMRPKHDPAIWNSFWTYPATGGSLEFSRLVSTYHSQQGSAKNTKNARLDELLEKAPTIADPNERKRAAAEAALSAKNEYSAVSLLDMDTILALGPKVGEVTPYPGAPDINGLMFKTITHAK